MKRFLGLSMAVIVLVAQGCGAPARIEQPKKPNQEEAAKPLSKQEIERARLAKLMGKEGQTELVGTLVLLEPGARIQDLWDYHRDLKAILEGKDPFITHKGEDEKSLSHLFKRLDPRNGGAEGTLSVTRELEHKWGRLDHVRKALRVPVKLVVIAIDEELRNRKAAFLENLSRNEIEKLYQRLFLSDPGSLEQMVTSLMDVAKRTYMLHLIKEEKKDGKVKAVRMAAAHAVDHLNSESLLFGHFHGNPRQFARIDHVAFSLDRELSAQTVDIRENGRSVQLGMIVRLRTEPKELASPTAPGTTPAASAAQEGKGTPGGSPAPTANPATPASNSKDTQPPAGEKTKADEKKDGAKAAKPATEAEKKDHASAKAADTDKGKESAKPEGNTAQKVADPAEALKPTVLKTWDGKLTLLVKNKEGEHLMIPMKLTHEKIGEGLKTPATALAQKLDTWTKLFLQMQTGGMGKAVASNLLEQLNRDPEFNTLAKAMSFDHPISHGRSIGALSMILACKDTEGFLRLEIPLKKQEGAEPTWETVGIFALKDLASLQKKASKMQIWSFFNELLSKIFGQAIPVSYAILQLDESGNPVEPTEINPKEAREVAAGDLIVPLEKNQTAIIGTLEFTASK